MPATLSPSDTIKLSASSAALPPAPIRLTFMFFSLMLLALNTYNLLKDETLYNTLLLMGILVIFGAGLAFLIRKANKKIEISVDSERIRSIETSTLTRTAYFSRIRSLTLTHSSVHIRYKSNVKERFHLPSYSGDEYKALNRYLQRSADRYAFSYAVKKYWF